MRSRKHALRWAAAAALLASVAALSAAPADAQATQAPIGVLDVVAPALGQITVAGWALDADTPTTALSIHIYIDGAFAGFSTADQSRPDVATAYPEAGALHGFSATISASGGTHFVCAYGINSGSGDNSTLAPCRTVNVPTGNPFGSIDTLSPTAGAFTASGWAIDPDTASAVDLHVYVDGAPVAAITANQARADVGAVFPGYGDGHGFAFAASAPPGVRTICLFAINHGAGANSPVGGSCRVVAIPSSEPIGSLDWAEPDAGGLWVGGWTLDPDAPAPTLIHVYVDGQFATADVADQPRPDVGASFPGFGDDHGFETFIPAAPGSHHVCAYAINATGPGGNTTLGCRSTEAWTESPVGSLDYVTYVPQVDGGIVVSGWAIDPETPDPIEVLLLVNGSIHTPLIASSARPDLGAAYPFYGPHHGFSAILDLGTGVHTVCAVAISVGGGIDTELGCRTISENSRLPLAAVDSVQVVGNQLVVTGWAFDPDQTAAPLIFIRRAGTLGHEGTVITGIARPDVGALHPFWPAAGFRISTPVAPGTQPGPGGYGYCLHVQNPPYPQMFLVARCF